MPLNGLELLIIAVVLLLLFGAKRLPEFGRSLGTGLREFKDSVGPGERDEPSERIDLNAGRPTGSGDLDSPRRVGDRVSS